MEMTTVETSIEVNVPVRTAYNQFPAWSYSGIWAKQWVLVLVLMLTCRNHTNPFNELVYISGP